MSPRALVLGKKVKECKEWHTYQGFIQDFQFGGERIFSEIFPEVYNLAKILLALPVGTATVERSFSHMKMIKTRLRNRLS